VKLTLVAINLLKLANNVVNHGRAGALRPLERLAKARPHVEAIAIAERAPHRAHDVEVSAGRLEGSGATDPQGMSSNMSTLQVDAL